LQIGDGDSEYNQELLKRLAEGDQQAFTEIIKKYRNKALNFAYRYLGNLEEAEDAAQDCFVRIYSHSAYFDSERRFEPWFYQILANCCRDRIRKKRRFTVLLDRLKFDKENNAVETGCLQASTEISQFAQALQQLSPSRREILILRFDEDLSYEEIAQTLGISIGTVMSRLHRAKKDLAKALKNMGIIS